jgi:hypothetical protein
MGWSENAFRSFDPQGFFQNLSAFSVISVVFYSAGRSRSGSLYLFNPYSLQDGPFRNDFDGSPLLFLIVRELIETFRVKKC